MRYKKELKGSVHKAKPQALVLASEYILHGTVVKTDQPPENAADLGDGFYYLPQGTPIPPDGTLGDDVPGGALLRGLLRHAGREDMASVLTEMDGAYVLIRFLDSPGACVPGETFIITPKVRNGRVRIAVSFVHRFAMRDSLTKWIRLKGVVRTRGIWVLVPGAVRIDRVVDLEGDDILLEKSGPAKAKDLRPFMLWGELPSGLRKKTLITKAITPKEALKKVDTFISYAFGDEASRFQEHEMGSFWKPWNLIFGNGATGNYTQELFWGQKSFFKALKKTARVALLLPRDEENQELSEFFKDLLERSMPVLETMGLPISLDAVAEYVPKDETSIPGALDHILKEDFDILMGMVVPWGVIQEQDPYFYTKRRLMAAGKPSQMIKVSTVRKLRDKYHRSDDSGAGVWGDELFQGVWINTGLKLGAIPWLIRETDVNNAILVGFYMGHGGFALSVFDHHMRFLGWRSAAGEPSPDLVEELLSAWEEPTRIFHAEPRSARAAGFLAGMGELCLIKDSSLLVAPGDRRAKLRAGMFLRSPDEALTYHIATENWAPYREFNLFEITRASGELPARVHAELCFWAARAYLSSFPKGPVPATLHFARGVANAVDYGFIDWGQGGDLPWFL